MQLLKLSFMANKKIVLIKTSFLVNTIITVDRFITEHVRHLNETTYILRFSGGGMDFKPGQHIKLGVKGSGQHREYSIYSSPDNSSLEVLIKDVDFGLVSTQPLLLLVRESLLFTVLSCLTRRLITG